MACTVLFDAGGTLVEVDGFFSFVAQHAKVSAERLEELFQERLEHVRHGTFQTVRAVMLQALQELSDATACTAGMKAYEEFFLEHVRLYPDALPLLEGLHKDGVHLLLVSDADADLLRPQLETLGITAFFDELIISSEVEAYKPSSAFVARTKAAYASHPPPAFFIGDSPLDQATAKACGVKTLLINREGNGDIHDLREVLALLHRELVVDLVAQNDVGEVLLVKRSKNERVCPGRWSLPGGTVEPTETPREALEREINEELSCTVEDSEHFHTLTIGAVRAKYYRGRVTGTITLNDENSAYEWVPLQEALQRPLAFNQEQILQQLQEESERRN